MKAWTNEAWWKLKWNEKENSLTSTTWNHRFEVQLPWYIALWKLSMWILGVLSIPFLIAGCIICEHVGWWGVLFLIIAILSWVYILLSEDKYFTWVENATTADKEDYYKTTIEPYNNEQQKLADEWRERHPLEEKCRLAMSKNPNYVADLIRYVQGEKND